MRDRSKHAPEVHLPRDVPMVLGGVQLQLLAETPEPGAPRKAPQPRQHQLRMQVGVLPLTAGLLHQARCGVRELPDEHGHSGCIRQGHLVRAA